MATIKYIIEKLLANGLIYFTPNLLAAVLSLPVAQAYDLIYRLKKNALILEVEKGKYFVVGFDKAKILANPWYVACKIFTPSYVSFWTALNYYGLTEQVPFKVFLAAARQKRKEIKFPAGIFKYVYLKPYKFFGYEEIRVSGLPILMAQKEKALIDSLDQPKYAGGIDEITKGLYNAAIGKEINLKRLIQYALKMRNKSLCSRLGYLLSLMKIKAKALKPQISRSFILLDPNKPKSKIWNKEWRVNVNLSKKELFSWRET